MKEQIKKTTIKELANHFDEELQTSLPITKLPDGSYSYKEFIVKKMPNQNWALYDIFLRKVLDEYFLISCALIAAHEYSTHRFNRYRDIKHIDTRYQAAYTDLMIFRHNIDLVTDPDQKEIFLTRLNESRMLSLCYKKTISRLFRNAFV